MQRVCGNCVTRALTNGQLRSFSPIPSEEQRRGRSASKREPAENRKSDDDGFHNGSLPRKIGAAAA